MIDRLFGTHPENKICRKRGMESAIERWLFLEAPKSREAVNAHISGDTYPLRLYDTFSLSNLYFRSTCFFKQHRDYRMWIYLTRHTYTCTRRDVRRERDLISVVGRSYGLMHRLRRDILFHIAPFPPPFVHSRIYHTTARCVRDIGIDVLSWPRMHRRRCTYPVLHLS